MVFDQLYLFLCSQVLSILALEGSEVKYGVCARGIEGVRLLAVVVIVIEERVVAMIFLVWVRI